MPKVLLLSTLKPPILAVVIYQSEFLQDPIGSQGVTHLCTQFGQASTLRANPKPHKNDCGLGHNFLRQPQEYARSLREPGTGEADRVFEITGYAIEPRAGAFQLGDGSKWIGEG